MSRSPQRNPNAIRLRERSMESQIAPGPTSVIPVVPATRLHTLLLHTLLLHGLLPLEQEAPVDIAMQDPPPGCRRQALALGPIGAIAGIAEVPTLEAPGVIASNRGRPGR